MNQRHSEPISMLEDKVNGNDGRSTLKKITDVYFAPKSFEKHGKIYEYAGVKLWQKVVEGTIGSAFRKTGMDEIAGAYFIGKSHKVSDLRKFELGTRFNELVHAPAAVWMACSLSEDLARHDWGKTALHAGLLIVNAGCAMLQRYNRARVYGALERRRAVESKYAARLQSSSH